ncbi:MAG: efflux RND transporter periplasmic adaptor subunit, partial [Actinobacteria bacterium]|nr:efflux RND transporter periplasmic adaptor subunit [Actinomycetota bacterium]
ATPGGDGTLRVGAPVVAGQTLFTVYDLSGLYVTADVDEVDVPRVRPGQRVEVLVDALPDATIVGRVEGVGVAAEQTATGGVGYPTRVRLLRVEAGRGPSSPSRSGLRVGMTASAEIVTRRVRSRTTVPSPALRREGQRTVVFTVRRGVARSVPVRVRAVDERLAAVTGRVTPRDRVIVAGSEGLSDGDPVSAARRVGGRERG